MLRVRDGRRQLTWSNLRQPTQTGHMLPIASTALARTSIKYEINKSRSNCSCVVVDVRRQCYRDKHLTKMITTGSIQRTDILAIYHITGKRCPPS